jgi:hypothetical protein
MTLYNSFTILLAMLWQLHKLSANHLFEVNHYGYFRNKTQTNKPPEKRY